MGVKSHRSFPEGMYSVKVFLRVLMFALGCWGKMFELDWNDRDVGRRWAELSDSRCGSTLFRETMAMHREEKVHLTEMVLCLSPEIDFFWGRGSLIFDSSCYLTLHVTIPAMYVSFSFSWSRSGARRGIIINSHAFLYHGDMTKSLWDLIQPDLWMHWYWMQSKPCF